MDDMDLATATPVEIDTALAEIYTRLYRLDDKIAQHLSWIKDMEEGLEKKWAGDLSYSSFREERLLELRTELREMQDQRLDVLGETAPYEAEYRRRPWSRFFLVSNSGGHIHSSMHCSTCYPTTRYAWLPELSGQSEPEAVAAHGAILCTVCYPSAPVEWTDRRDDSVCAGSGQVVNRTLPHRLGYYSGNWGTCPVCGTQQTATKSSKIRKHKKEG